jgi:hypothetical protein
LIRRWFSIRLKRCRMKNSNWFTHSETVDGLSFCENQGAGKEKNRKERWRSAGQPHWWASFLRSHIRNLRSVSRAITNISVITSYTPRAVRVTLN